MKLGPLAKLQFILLFTVLIVLFSLLSYIVTSRDINVDIFYEEFIANNHVSNDFQAEIGEFEIEGIIHEKPHTLWERTGEQAGVTKERFLEYFKDKAGGYAIKVKNTGPYDEPKSLDSLMVSYPPQSFV